MKNSHIVLVDLQYPYGKPHVYMNGSLVDVAARLIASGCEVQIVDLNIDRIEDVQSSFCQADLIGVSVVGSPYLPSAIEFAQTLKVLCPQTKLMYGGQVIENLTSVQFAQLFRDTQAVQIKGDADLVRILGCQDNLSASLSASHLPVWQQMGPSRLKQYLAQEFALVTAQGCVYKCAFCAAAKDRREQHVTIDNFRQDMLFLANQAHAFGLVKLECYASALDFFQNPRIIVKYLQVLADVREETGVDLRTRCLSCLGSFLRASREISDFANLMHRSGLWCIGFGADGTDEEVWAAQKKRHNHVSDIAKCLDLCEAIGVRPELLMVLGFPEDGIRSSWKNFKNSIKYAFRWRSTLVRPYLAKPFVPGNEGWNRQVEQVEQVIHDPRKFFHLDFCALGSPLTHPGLIHRWICNMTFLAIIVVFLPFGRCVTSPLLPQGGGGLIGKIAKVINRLMPFDR